MDGAKEEIYIVGLNATYQISPWIAAEAGYNFDELSSDLCRGFDRNRLYIGLRATY